MGSQSYLTAQGLTASYNMIVMIQGYFIGWSLTRHCGFFQHPAIVFPFPSPSALTPFQIHIIPPNLFSFINSSQWSIIHGVEWHDFVISVVLSSDIGIAYSMDRTRERAVKSAMYYGACHLNTATFVQRILTAQISPLSLFLLQKWCIWLKEENC